MEQLALGSALTQRVPNPFFGIIPRSSSLGDPTIPMNQLLRPYPMYTTVSQYRNNVGTTFYQGAYVKLEQRFSKGLSYLVELHPLEARRRRLVRLRRVDSHRADRELPGGRQLQPQARTRLFDRRHSAHLRGVGSLGSAVRRGPARTPGGILGAVVNDWTLSGVVTLQSGIPIAVTQATNNNAFAGFGTQRPNVTGDPTLPADERSATRWFNTAAFSTAPQFTLGNASRNPVRGPGYRNLDLALVRRVPLPAGNAIELRAEGFNVTNTTPFGAPNGVFGSAAFGTITTAGDPRVIQLAVKFVF